MATLEGFSLTSSYILRPISLNFKMTFVREYNPSPFLLIPFFLFFAHCSLFFLITVVKSCFFLGLLAILPLSINILLIVDECAFTTAAEKSLLRSTLVFLGSLTLFLIIIWSSRAVVFLFLLHLPCRWIVTSSLSFSPPNSPVNRGFGYS